MANASHTPDRVATRLQQDLLDRVIQLIHDDGLTLGARVNEHRLARRLAVSRSPVRAVLDQLADEGFLAHRPQRGMELIALPERPATPKENEKSEESLLVAIARDRDEEQLTDDVSETELMRRYVVPRRTLRGALILLADLGALERKAGYGWRFLNRWDHEARQESYAFRLLIEPAAILLPGFQLAPGWAREMRDRHEQVLTQSWTDTSSITFFEMNAAFHEGIALASGNRHFHAAIRRQNRLRRLNLYNWKDGFERVRKNHVEHMEILDWLERGDRDVAAALMRRHLQIARDMRPGPSHREKS